MEEKVEMEKVEQRSGSKASSAEPWFWRRTHPSLSDGIVVVTAWLLSKPRQLERYSRFYASCNWDSLISHPNVVNLWYPELAKRLAVQVLDELARELQKRPRLVVFATFSGGYMACLWKIYQILQGTCDGVDCTLEKYKTVRNCVAGQIHDSSPADFVYQDWGPILVLGCKDDDIVSFDEVQEFCSRMTGLGCNVTLVAWDESAHVGHFKRHEDDYKNAVRSFLEGVKESHAHKSANPSSAAHVELSQTNGYMTTQLSTVWFRGSNSSSGSAPANGSLAFSTSRL